MTRAYYNEIDPFAAEWLRMLILNGEIAEGDVDTRSIEDVLPGDLIGYTQCHFFAGIGGWSRALRLAGWPDSRPVWSASLPCQPFSVANVAHGGGKGFDDPRHLLPVFIDLVRKSKPDVIFGEQVTKAITKGWLDLLITAFEVQNYAIGSLVLPARMFGADHQRKRLFWVANSRGARRPGYQSFERFSFTAQTSFPIPRDSFLRARRVMDHDYESLLPCDGLSVVMERSALKGYGNAIVPQVAAEFIQAWGSL